MSGCFLLDLLLSDARAGDVLTERLRLAFGTGFCSSFTTYSTFLLDAVTSAPAVAVAYGIASYAGGFAAVLLGRIVVVGVEGTPVGRPVREEK